MLVLVIWCQGESEMFSVKSDLEPLMFFTQSYNDLHNDKQTLS